MELSRRDLILKDIVEYFIKTAQPVGSSTLIEVFDLPYSSATIRNEMMELERLGYIEKTHTSSGRIPSTNGYRYYVERLRDKDINNDVKFQLSNIFSQREKSIEDVIKDSCEILSHMTNLASVVLGPDSEQEHLLSAQLIPLSENSATCVLVTDKGYVENKTFIFKKDTSMKDMQDCVKVLNDRLVGTPINELVTKMNTIKPLIDDYVKNNDAIYRILSDAIMRFSESRASMFGQNNLLNQPEFNNDAIKIKKMLELLENPEKMTKEMEKEKIDNEEGFELYIGSKNQDSELSNVSVVKREVNINGKQLGKIALVGPTRMDYDKVLSALEYVIEKIDEFYGGRKD